MRKLRFRDSSSLSTFDLNLAPMMDMMVSIIPFMLLSATFMQLMLISVPLPAPVAQALQQDRDNKNKDISIKVAMSNSKEMFLDVKDASGHSNRVPIPKLSSGDFDFSMLHKRLVETKLKFPKIFKIELNPETNVDYRAIVGVMDTARSIEGSDPKVMIDNVESPLLFPDVILANVMDE